MTFNGLHMGLGNITKLSNAKARSITAENVYGEKGKGGMAEVSDTPQPEVEKIGQKWDGPNQCARYLPLQDDISSVAYWYQAEPHHPFPEFPDRDILEVI